MFLLYTLAAIYLLTFLACMYVLIFTIIYGTKNSYMLGKRIDYFLWASMSFIPLANIVCLTIVWKDYFNSFSAISSFLNAEIKNYSK